MHCLTTFRGIVLGTMQHPAFLSSYFGSKPCHCTSSTNKAVSKFCSRENKQRAGVLLQVCSASPSIGCRTLGRVMSPIYLERNVSFLVSKSQCSYSTKGSWGRRRGEHSCESCLGVNDVVRSIPGLSTLQGRYP